MGGWRRPVILLCLSQRLNLKAPLLPQHIQPLLFLEGRVGILPSLKRLKKGKANHVSATLQVKSVVIQDVVGHVPCLLLFAIRARVGVGDGFPELGKKRLAPPCSALPEVHRAGDGQAFLVWPLQQALAVASRPQVLSVL